MTFSGTVSLVAVLLFHTIGAPGPYTVSPQTFQKELQLLQAEKVQVLTLSQFEDYVNGSLQVTRPSVLITFDDGNLSDYTQATPLLQKFHDHAAGFLIGKRLTPGHPTTVDPQDVEAMAKTGVWTFGSHTYNLHSPYSGPDGMNNLHYYAKAGMDVTQALLQDMDFENVVFAGMGLPTPNAFAFPFGFYTPQDVSILHRQFPYLFTSNTGFAQIGEYLIPRINVGSDFASYGRLQRAIRLMQAEPATVQQAVYETRAQFVVQLDQSLGIQKISPAVPTFSDVPTSNPDYRYIEAAYQAGFINGIGGSEFGPSDPITRAEAAKILVEAYEGGNYTPTATTTGFTDNAAIPPPLVPYVAQAATLGLMRGLPSGQFDPEAYLTQAQEAHLVTQLDTVVATKGGPPRAAKVPQASPN